MGASVHAARFAPGVIGLIMDGERPARVPNNVIDELKGREHNGIIALPKKPQLDPRAGFQINDRCQVEERSAAALWGTSAERKAVEMAPSAAASSRAVGDTVPQDQENIAVVRPSLGRELIRPDAAVQYGRGWPRRRSNALPIRCAAA
jgi:hypothetical protein